jgi:peptide/nickel transport system permease protein
VPSYIAQKVVLAGAVALFLSIVTFALLNAAIDPAAAIAGEDASTDQIEALRAQYGFDRPLHVRYLDWLGGVLTGDLGESYFWNRPVADLIAARAPVTIALALSALAVTIAIAVPLGIAAATNPGGSWDKIALTLASAAQATPSFWIGLIAILVFAVELGVAPASGAFSPAHFVLPAFVLGLVSTPAVLRLTRAGMIEALASDYVRTARAKGLLMHEVVERHALRNALLPVVSVLAVQLGAKLGGSVVTESVFAINGLGRLALDSILGADVPTLQMLVFVFAMTFLGLTLAADLLNAWLDPRMRVAPR